MKSPNHAHRAERWSVAARVAIALAAAFLIFSGAYWLTRVVLARMHIALTPYALVMVTVGVAFCLVAVAGALFARLSNQRDVLDLILDFIRQMARGNFHARISPDTLGRRQNPDHPFQQLINSLNTMAADLARLEAMRQEFIGNVSHEIQSPLSAIAGFAHILQSQQLTEEQKHQYLDIIHTESQRLSRLTQNLLQLTSLESGAHPVHLKPVPIDRQIRDSVVALEPLWSPKQLTLDVAVEPVVAQADPDLLNQVWVNLLTNAVKFTPSGGRIRIEGGPSGDWVAVAVEDSGLGISQEDLPRIFERFYKSDRARTRTTPGSGLGLAIVKKIVDMHGGRIGVESEPGQGTRVRIQIPSR